MAPVVFKNGAKLAQIFLDFRRLKNVALPIVSQAQRLRVVSLVTVTRKNRGFPVSYVTHFGYYFHAAAVLGVRVTVQSHNRPGISALVTVA